MKGKAFIEPYSPEWFNIRLGKWTASKADLLFKAGKAKDAVFGEGALTHIDVLIDEILTGEQVEAKGWQLDWGISQEPFANEMYSLITNQETKTSGFYEYDAMSGGTPDFETQDNKGIGEIKCPANGAIYLKIARCESVDELRKFNPLYYCQPQSNMLFAEKEYADFVAFNPRIKNVDLQMKIFRMYPDEVWRKDYHYRMDLVAEIMVERIENLLKLPEKNLAYRVVKVDDTHINKLTNALTKIQKSA